MNVNDKRGNVCDWEMTNPYRHSSDDTGEDHILYENCTFEFKDKTGKVLEMGFVIGPVGYSVSINNNLSSSKSTKGNVIVRNGASIGTVSLSIVLMDTADCKERLTTVENFINLSCAQRTNDGYKTLFSAAIVIEGVRYSGYFTGYSTSKTADGSPYIYTMSTSFNFYSFKIISPVNINNAAKKVIMLTPGVIGTGQEDFSGKVENYSFVPSDITVTDEDSMIIDSTLKDVTATKPQTTSESYFKVVKSDPLKKMAAKIYIAYAATDSKNNKILALVPEEYKQAEISIGKNFLGRTASDVEKISKLAPDNKIYLPVKMQQTGGPQESDKNPSISLSDFIYISNYGDQQYTFITNEKEDGELVLKYFDETMPLKDFSVNGEIYYLIKRENCEETANGKISKDTR